MRDPALIDVGDVHASLPLLSELSGNVRAVVDLWPGKTDKPAVNPTLPSSE